MEPPNGMDQKLTNITKESLNLYKSVSRVSEKENRVASSIKISTPIVTQLVFFNDVYNK